MRMRSVRGVAAGWCRAAVVVATAIISGVASAQVLETLPLARTYGSGVHAYFCGDYDRSYEDLTAAIEAGSQDPRARYFRGLAALKLGRTDESEADFMTGSKKESDNTGAWGVARALERVQGCDRLKLERYRVEASVASIQEDRRRTRLRYLGVESAEPQVLRDRVPETVRPPLPGQPLQPSPEGEPEEPAREDDAPADTLPAPQDNPADGTDTPMKVDGGTTEL